MAIVGLSGRVPTPDDLEPVSGPLASYAVHWSAKGRPTIILSISGVPNRFWTDAISPRDAESLFGRNRPVQITVFRYRVARYPPMDRDAYKSYGLSVNGHEVVSLATALGKERTLLVLGFPLLGVVSVGFAVLVYRKRRREELG